MSIDTLTLFELREIANLFKTAPSAPAKRAAVHRRPVVVRSSQSGVWFGMLVGRHGSSVDLANARKIWSWQGANTTSDIALTGVGPGSKVAPPVTATVVEVHEIIDATPEAAKAIEARSWGK